MKQVPPEIDALMWRLAEELNPVAQAEFETRHARFGPELTRRIRMVAELREAGKPVVHRPAFTPRPTKVATVPRFAIGGTIGLAVLAVGAVAYVVASNGEKAMVTPLVRSSPVQRINPPTVEAPPKKREPSAVPGSEEPTVGRVPEGSVPGKIPDSTKPVDLQIKDTDLTTAIELVAKAGGLAVTVAPGFPDRRVTFDYGSLTPLETLKTMGENYGFSVIEEQEGQWLVVPAREQTSDRRVGT